MWWPLLPGAILALASTTRLSLATDPLDLAKLNVTEHKAEQLVATCADIAHKDGAGEVSLFEDASRTKHDCCTLQIESECRDTLCKPGLPQALLDGRSCDYFGKRLHTYQDNLFDCDQAGLKCDLVRARSASDQSQSGGGGMPIWLIILLVVLILVGIVMIVIVVRLFAEDKEQKGASARSKVTAKQPRRASKK